MIQMHSAFESQDEIALSDCGDRYVRFVARLRSDKQRATAPARISGDPSVHFAIHTLVADGLFSCWDLNDDD